MFYTFNILLPVRFPMDDQHRYLRWKLQALPLLDETWRNQKTVNHMVSRNTRKHMQDTLMREALAFLFSSSYWVLLHSLCFHMSRPGMTWNTCSSLWGVNCEPLISTYNGEFLQTLLLRHRNPTFTRCTPQCYRPLHQ